MAELIVHNPPRAALKASGYIGSPEGDIELTENDKTYNVADFATATTRIPKPPEPTGTKEIIENGVHDVKEYAFADVKIPEPSGTIVLDENNRSYDVTDYAAADVAIPEEEKTVMPSTTRQEVTPDNGLLSKVTVLPAPLEERTVTPTIVQQTITPEAPAIGLSKVTVGAALPPPILVSKQIIENGTYTAENDNADGYSEVTVEVPTPTFESKAVTPMAIRFDVEPSEGFDGLSKVTVNATPLEEKTIIPTSQQQVVTPTAPNIGLSSVTVAAAPEDTGEDGLYRAMLEGTVVDVYDNKLLSAIGFKGQSVPVKTVFLLKAENISTFDGNQSIKSIFFPKATIMPSRNCYQCSALIDYIMPLALGATYAGDTGNQRHFSSTPVKHIIVGWKFVGFRGYEGVRQIETYVMTNAQQTGVPEKVLTNFHTCVLLTSNTSLSNISMFSGTKIESGEGYIYVPEQDVVSYKNATNWSVYAERIVGINTQTTVAVGDTFTPPIPNNIISWDVIKLNSWDCGNVNSITGAFNATFVGFLLLRGLSVDGNPLYVAYIEVTEAKHDN